MSSNRIKASILKHLSEKPDTWSSTIAKITSEIQAGALFVEAAMKDLVESGELKRMAGEAGGMPSYAPPGKVDGKYGDFYQKRLSPSKGWNQKYDEDPWHKDIKGPEAV